jgi:hypothetical protein
MAAEWPLVVTAEDKIHRFDILDAAICPVSLNTSVRGHMTNWTVQVEIERIDWEINKTDLQITCFLCV